MGNFWLKSSKLEEESMIKEIYSIGYAVHNFPFTVAFEFGSNLIPYPSLRVGMNSNGFLVSFFNIKIDPLFCLLQPIYPTYPHQTLHEVLEDTVRKMAT